MRVVIAPASATAGEVLDRLTTWSSCALIDAFCWWSAPEDGSATLEVRRVERGRHHVEPLAEALAGARPENVELVAFLPASTGEVVSAAFADVADTCLTMANRVLAFSVESARECTMVVAPAEVGQPVPCELFLAQWAANVYVAPEDRTNPSDFNHLADAGGHAFARHAAHALASIADLWVGASRRQPGVLATLTQRQPNLAPAPVQVVRCFSRVLDYGYVVDHIATGVFKVETAWPNPDPPKLDRIADPGEILPDVALSFLDKHKDVLDLSDCPPLVLGPPERLGLFAALRLLVKLIVRRLRRKPYEMLESQIAKLHDAAATRIEEYSGGSILVSRYSDSAGSKRGPLHMKEACLDRSLYVPDGPVVKAWTDLRRLSLGLVDGGAIPPDIADQILKRGALRALVTHPPSIAPDPADKPPATDGYPDPRACDPLRFLEEHGGDVEPAAAERAVPDAGLESSDTSFLGLVGTGIAKALLQARREAAADHEPTDEQRAAWRAAAAKRRRARRGVVFKALGATIVAAALGYVAWTHSDLLPGVLLLLLIFGLWLVIAAFLARALFYVIRGAARARVQRQFDELHGALLKAQRSGDADRLERRYSEFLDWAEILGWLVHAPWMAEPLDGVDAFGQLEPETMPAALQIGITLQSDKHLAQLIGRGRARMFTPGWLGALYQGVERLAMQDLALMADIALDGGGLDLPDPAADLREDPESPRRVFLRAIVRGDGRHLDDNPLSQDLLRMINSMPLDDVAREVHVAQEGDDNVARALPAAVGWFDPPVDLEVTAKPLRHAVVSMMIDGAQTTGAIVDGRVITVEARDGGPVQVDTADGLTRMMSVVRATGGLMLLENVGEPAATPAGAEGTDEAAEEREADGDDSRSDADRSPSAHAFEPLPEGFEVSSAELAVGQPVLGIGRDNTRWGLITAAQRGRPARVTFSAAVGPAGTPIVDLDGRLLGIQGRPPAPRRGVIPRGNEANLIGVAIVTRPQPDEGGEEPPATPQSASLRRSGTPARPTPTEFLAEPFQHAAGMALLPQHWTDNRDGHLIEDVAPEPPDLSPAEADIGVLSTGARFHEPLRLLVHRVDLTHPVTTDQLTSCRAAPSD